MSKNSILLYPLLVHCLGRTKPDIALNLKFANILTRGDKKLCGKLLYSVICTKVNVLMFSNF